MGVDLEAVWEVTQRDIPALRLAVERLLAQTEQAAPEDRPPDASST